MKYLIPIMVIVLAFISIPVIADTGVGINLTTTIIGGGTGGGGGGGGGFVNNPPVPYSPPDWTKMFPSMLTQTPQSSSPYVPIVQPPMPLPPPLAYSNTQPAPYTPPAVTAPGSDKLGGPQSWLVYVLIGVGALIILVILFLAVTSFKPKKQTFPPAT